MGNVQDTQSGDPNAQNGNATPSRPAPVVSPVYPSLNNGDHDYEILLRPGNTPSRPAPPAPPRHPVVAHQNSTHTLSSNFHGLDGVPFVVNPKFLNSNSDRVRNKFFLQENENLIRKLGSFLGLHNYNKIICFNKLKKVNIVGRKFNAR